MGELEYEVIFEFGLINVTALAYVDEGDFSENETLEQVAIRRAESRVSEEFGDLAYHYGEVSVKHTGTIGLTK